MSNETVKRFDIMIKLRGDNVYDLYIDGEHTSSRGNCDALLDDAKVVIREKLLGEENRT